MSGLELQNISKSFGSASVLKDVTCRFEPGEATAIVGDNGAGKSTLLKTIAGIYVPDRGSIFLDNTELRQLTASEHRMHGIEMVYQDLALAKQHDVITNFYLGRELRSKIGFLDRSLMKRTSAEKLKELEIQIPDLTRAIGLLSGGQQQAVAIARAVLFDPKVLLLDEPTAALAAREVEQVLELIRRQKQKNRAVILVSHRLNDVFAVADRILVMKQGSIMNDYKTCETTLPEIVERIVS